MTSEWDNTPWGGFAVPAKAVTGPFASRVEYGTPLASLSRSPQRKMRDAQALYHTNPWIRTAESTVTRKVVGLGWHLETGDDEEVPDTAGGIPGTVVRLMERPQANLDLGRKMTRRDIVAITSRHLGLCGLAYWFFDQMEPIARTPLGILYVNPARVWAAADDTGNLTGWVLDPKDETGRGGTPLALDELLPFYLDPPDWGHYGSGLVEAAWQKAQITTLADRHAAYILGTGGRLPGIVSPKEGTIETEQYEALVREFRNVNEAPDAAKRTTVVRGPIDFTETSADPSELALLDLSKMNRDDILAVWGVPPSQAAIPAAAGLNSGQTRAYDEAVLMQGSVHDRVQAIREAIQYGLLDRYQKLGVTLDLEIEEPEFDDATPAYENAARAVNIPLTNAERRAIIGLAPTGDALIDNVILLPLTLTPFDGQPTAVLPPVIPVKAAESKFTGLRAKMEARFVPSLRTSLAGALAEQRGVIAGRIRERGAKLERKRNDATIWWDGEDERLARVLRAGATGIAQTVARQIDALLRVPGKADYEDQVVAYVTKRTGERITAINGTTRDAVQAAITQGFDDGLSPLEIAGLIEDLPAFDLARAELVARTETMLAYNDAALTSYGEFGVVDVLAYDGDQDEECAARDGQTFSLADSFDIIDHPNGTLDWAPVVPGRAYEEAAMNPAQFAELKAMLATQVAPIIRVEAAAQAAPVVNIAPTVVNVAAPEVHVAAAEVTVPAPVVNVAVPEQAAPIVINAAPEHKAALPSVIDVRIVERPAVTRKVKRDTSGRITSVTEE